MTNKLSAMLALLLASIPLNAEEIKFPKIDMHRAKANYSFIQTKISTNSFRFEENSRNGFQMDFRNCDLTAYDLANNRFMDYASFNTKTKFPEKLPEGFQPERNMEYGKNPGLGIKTLHKQGITGKNIGIGIIDQALLSEHAEYADRLRLYEEIHCLARDASMHGPAVASIAAGKTVGVAPGADLYFIGQTNGASKPDGEFEFDLASIAQSINRLVEVNNQLPEGRKIRVISISLALMPQFKSYEETAKAIDNAARNGILVLSVGNQTVKVDGLGRPPSADPDKLDSFSAGIMFTGNRNGSGAETLQVPMDSRTMADPNGEDVYYFSRVGGQSWIIPWTAGLYALACQIYPAITPEIFKTAALATADSLTFKRDGNTYTLQKVVNPTRLMEKLKQMNKAISAGK